MDAMKKYIFFAFALIGSSLANAQWWNPMAPKDFNDCIIKNLKDGMGDDAVSALKYACYQKFGEKEEKLEEAKRSIRYKKCGYPIEIRKSSGVFDIEFEDGRLSSQIKQTLDKIIISDYDPTAKRIKIQNKNEFSISYIKIGLTKSKTCPQKESAYEAISYCGEGYNGLGAQMYGTFSCTEVPPKTARYGYCIIGYAPVFKEYDDSLLDHIESRGFCRKSIK